MSFHQRILSPQLCCIRASNQRVSFIMAAEAPNTDHPVTHSTLLPLPLRLKAFQDNWTEIPTSTEAFTIVTEEEYLNNNSKDVLSNTLNTIATKMKHALALHTEEVNPFQIFEHLIQPAIPLLCDFTTQELVPSGKGKIYEHEMYTFIAILILSAGYHYNPERKWQKMNEGAKGFVVMPRKRFNEILYCL